jgi:hypothetical protein
MPENEEVFETFSQRAFCFGCDEGRSGQVLRIPRRLAGERFVEVVCEGCKKILDLLRPLTLPFVQTESHEGTICWRVSLSDYRRHTCELGIFRDETRYDGVESVTTVCLLATDDGSADDLVHALVRCRLKDVLLGDRR